MRRFLLSLILAGASVSAYAVPIPFDFSGGSLSATGAVALASYTPNSGSALLDNGESQAFDFGMVSVLGFGSGQLTVSVDFVSPIFGSAGVTGPYSVFNVVLVNSGQWSGGSTTFNYNYLGNAGSAQLAFDPINTTCFLCQPAFTFTGTLTNLGSMPVPEPGALTLLGIGLTLVGALSVGRRRKVR